jgi:peptidoglycan/LPS O-acetylase OafA/YrhL
MTFVVATLCVWKFPLGGLDRVIVPLCLAVSLVFIDCLPRTILTMLTWQPLRWMGLTSFSMYLWQQPPFVALLKGEIAPLPALAIAVAAGTLSYYFFENPLRIAINERWDRRKSAAKAALHHA